MNINTKELRRLAQIVQSPAHNIHQRMSAIHSLHDALPSGVVLELLDRLEAAEKERDALHADFETAHAQMMTSAAAEREACAKVCEKLTKPSHPVPGHPIDAWLLATVDCAEVIRARSALEESK